MSTEKKTDSYYVQVRTPDELRRRILESSKAVVHTLQEYQNVLEVREKKKKLLEMLKTQMEEIIVLQEKLSAVLPEFELPVEKPKPVPKKKGKHKKKHSAPVQKTELDALNDTLSKIEEKLRKLD
ncbi:MAG: hypothetical protein ABIA93_01265 [Candidatus Woesearchaeota archaeon]